MASVVKEFRNGRTLYRVQFRNADKRRKSIRLGGVNRKDAEHICSKVQSLVNASIGGRPLDSDVAAWVAKLGDDLACKLSDAGLIDKRAKATLGPFVDGYIASRTEAASNTVRNWKDTRRKLTNFLGEDRDLRAISAGDADAWRQGLVDAGKAEATVSKAVKHAKFFGKMAVRQCLADSNPFAGLKGGSERDDSRKAFISQATTARVLAACPDAEWQIIIALARYGGLRCPSEILRLEWQHVDWAGGRLTVPSPKTKRFNKPWRVVPLFLELKPYLEAAFERAPEGARFVVHRYRDSDTNLRTHFLRILQKAGVEPWQRLFQNLRASRETELCDTFPLHVVTAWLGNTPMVASQHYLQVTPQHFEMAQGGAGGGAQVVQQVVLQASAGLGNQSQEMKETPRKTQVSAIFPEVSISAEYPRQETNTCGISRGKPNTSLQGGATGGAFSDASWCRLVELWPTLSDTTRHQLVALAEAESQVSR